MRALRRRLPAALALLVLVTACGGDGDAGQASSTTAPDGATTTTEPTFTGAGSEQFCAQAIQAQAQLAQLTQGTQGTGNPDAVKAVYVSAARALQSLADIAPAEIKPDVAVLAGAYQEVATEAERAGPQGSPFSPTILRRLTQPDVTTASARLQAYQEKVCGQAPG